MPVARTVIEKLPVVPAGRKTASVLSRVSAAPPVIEPAPEKTFPLKRLPLTVTSRSRSFTQALPLVAPGASVQASMTLNGLEESVMLPLKVKVWPAEPKTWV